MRMIFFCIFQLSRYTKEMTTEEIKKLADLSRLSLDESQIEAYRSDFEGILKYIDSLKDVRVSETEPHYVSKNVTRDDTHPYEPGTFTKELLAAAPETDGNYIKVNKVL